MYAGREPDNQAQCLGSWAGTSCKASCLAAGLGQQEEVRQAGVPTASGIAAASSKGCRRALAVPFRRPSRHCTCQAMHSVPWLVNATTGLNKRACSALHAKLLQALPIHRGLPCPISPSIFPTHQLRKTHHRCSCRHSVACQDNVHNRGEQTAARQSSNQVIMYMSQATQAMGLAVAVAAAVGAPLLPPHAGSCWHQGRHCPLLLPPPPAAHGPKETLYHL